MPTVCTFPIETNQTQNNLGQTDPKLIKKYFSMLGYTEIFPLGSFRHQMMVACECLAVQRT